MLGRGWIGIERLSVGDALATRAGPALVVQSITNQHRAEGYLVYNLTVEGDHTYFVGKANGGVWAHNTLPCKGFDRPEPNIEDGNLDRGWEHIDKRHVTGGHPDGEGDMFASGTTREQLQEAAKRIVAKGKRLSDPARRMQRFQKRISVNGLRDHVTVILDSRDGSVITMFPARQ